MLSFFPEAYSLSGLGRKARQDLFHDPSQPPEWNLVSDRPGHRKMLFKNFNEEEKVNLTPISSCLH